MYVNTSGGVVVLYVMACVAGGEYAIFIGYNGNSWDLLLGIWERKQTKRFYVVAGVRVATKTGRPGRKFSHLGVVFTITV